MSFYKNPFPAADVDRHEIWQMLVERDIIAFCQESWEMVDDDFIKENFIGVDAGKRHNPDSWRLGFPDLEHYKEEWLRQARYFAQTHWAEDPERAMYHATTLRDIDIQGDSAVAHKKFDGEILKPHGEKTVLNWQTLYHCRKIGGRWKIAGFTGYLPHPMGFGGEQGTGGRQQLRDALQSKDEFQSRDGLQLKDELQSQEGLQPKGEIRFQAEQKILIKPQTQEKQQNLDRSRTENKQRIQDENQSLPNRYLPALRSMIRQALTPRCCRLLPASWLSFPARQPLTRPAGWLGIPLKNKPITPWKTAAVN